jgi:hypothetical protein
MFSVRNVGVEVIKALTNPNNLYDATILFYKYMPPKTTACALTILTSGVVLTQSETLVNKVGTILVSAGVTWATTETAHYIGSKLWAKRWNQIKSKIAAYETSPEGIERRRRIQEEVDKMLEEMFSDPNFMQKNNL